MVKEQAMKVGPHTNALTSENVELILDDIRYQEKDGFVCIGAEEQWEEISTPNLKILKVAVVSQTDRPGRIILTLSVPVSLLSYRPQGKRRRA